MNEGLSCFLAPFPDAEGQPTDRICMTPGAAARLGLRHGGEAVLQTFDRAVSVRVDTARFDVPFDAVRAEYVSQEAGPSLLSSNGELTPVFASPRLLRRLLLPPAWPLQWRPDGLGRIAVGPIVGIFCQRYLSPSIYGPQTRFFRRLIELGRRMGMFVYVFETRDVNRASRTIDASTWLPRRGWVRLRCPLPHVVYDRGMVTPSVMRVHRWLRRQGVAQFNGYVGSKLWVYRLLLDTPELAPFVPPTRVLRRPADLIQMTREHGTVFVKSAGGGKGIGIWVVGRRPGRGYAFRYTDARTRIHRGTTEDAGSIVRRLLAAPRQPWFIQPRLDLLRWRERIFDARVLVQRDGTGQLKITGTGARIGRKGSFISNIHGGGEARPLPLLLQECLDIDEEKARAMQQRIEGIALQAARIIDGAIQNTGTVGELGIDIAIDRNGRLWFLEANSRTGRNVFGMAGMRERAYLAMVRPLQYARRAAGFAPGTVPIKRRPAAEPSP